MSQTITYRSDINTLTNQHLEISSTILSLLKPIASPGRYAIDIGCGVGRFTFATAPYLAHVIGIDRNPESIQKAQASTKENGCDNVTFFVADAESADYCEFLSYEPYDLVTAHLCFSPAIVQQAHAALRSQGRFIFTAIEASQWRETDHTSQYSFTEKQLLAIFENIGFHVEYLGIETEISEFKNPSEDLRAWTDTNERPKWLSKIRAEGLHNYFQKGGKEVTIRSQLIGRVQKK